MAVKVQREVQQIKILCLFGFGCHGDHLLPIRAGVFTLS